MATCLRGDSVSSVVAALCATPVPEALTLVTSTGLRRALTGTARESLGNLRFQDECCEVETQHRHHSASVAASPHGRVLAEARFFIWCRADSGNPSYSERRSLNAQPLHLRVEGRPVEPQPRGRAGRAGNDATRFPQRAQNRVSLSLL